MRGKAPENLHHGERWRITPAYAGKSVEFADILDYSRDHPRLCGEKKTGATGVTSSIGITPAYAGKSI